MAKNGKIESDKVLLKKLFTDFWFRIPNYQRSYVWENDQINELVDDLSYAAENHPENEYFLGSMVLQKKDSYTHKEEDAINFTEYDILDGQQRSTSLMLLIAVLRDITQNATLKSLCVKSIYQEKDEFSEIPERLRITYQIRDNVEDFINSYVKQEGGTLLDEKLREKSKVQNTSIANMAKAILQLKKRLGQKEQKALETFAKFLFNRVLVIYVSSENLEDAFRLFTILNDRGMPLSNSDILKAQNLGAIKNDKIEVKYAKFWEDTEGYLGRDEFDRLLSHIRTIFVKEKARDNILKEFAEKIYDSKPPKLNRGADTLDVIKEYVEIYGLLYFLEDLPNDKLPNEYKNLITIMDWGLPSSDWIPALLFYYKKFGRANLFNFLKKLDNKFSGDWINQLTPTFRIKNMNEILKVIDDAASSEEVLNAPSIFKVDTKMLETMLDADIYKRRFAKYILLKTEYLAKDHSAVFQEFDYVSLEHILPQNPKHDSTWWNYFSVEEHEEYLHKMGNLVLMSRRKNSRMSNKDFLAKKNTYFEGNIDGFAQSLKVMQYDEWTKERIEQRQESMLKELLDYYNS